MTLHLFFLISGRLRYRAPDKRDCGAAKGEAEQVEDADAHYPPLFDQIAVLPWW